MYCPFNLGVVLLDLIAWGYGYGVMWLWGYGVMGLWGYVVMWLCKITQISITT